MSFKDLNLAYTYSSISSDLLNDFYIPVLSEAVKYDRIAGYFNSTSLAIAARALSNFVNNKGKMRLLCGAQLDEEDLNSILNANEIKEQISNSFLNDINNLESGFVKNHVKLLAWMVANKDLEIKIAIKRDNGGYFGGIFHSKNGLMWDKEDNCLSFTGSNNETASGWLNNIEKFKLFSSWEEEKYVVPDIEEFNSLWNNEFDYLDVFEIPNAAKLGLIKLAPKNEEDLEELLDVIRKNSSVNGDKRELYPHQIDAINAWFKNANKGIFEMATGTGKTFTSIKAVEKLKVNITNLIVVIACPLAHLAEQWKLDVEKLGFAHVYSIYGSANSNWKNDLERLVFNLKLGVIDDAVVVTTHNTFSSEFFINKINDIDNPLLLIVDEMHHVGSLKYKSGLLNKYNYRLGLSATPSRYMDDEGTNYLLDYFGGIIFKFDIEDALFNTDKEGKPFLTPYYYCPIRIMFTGEESEEYKKLSLSIAQLYTRLDNKHDKSVNEALQNAIRKRKRLVNNAERKYDVLIDILNKIDDLDHLIIFCSPQQRGTVLKILKDMGIGPVHSFTNKEGTKRTNEFHGLSEREYLLKMFDKGEYKVLIAMKCLDEGVDVPSADKVIIMSSTTNPMEYIQRRGRVLRRYPNKNKAMIYDMVVIPEERFDSLIKSENERIWDFITTAKNSSYAIDLIEKWGL